MLLESYPDDLAASLEARAAWRREAAETNPGLEFLVTDLARWAPGQVVRVAFLGGAGGLHRAIATTVEAIDRACGLTLDFGWDDASGEARRWRTDDVEHGAEIRVSFDLPGNWSLVGTASVDSTVGEPGGASGGRPGQRSLNLGGFDARLPPKWERTVLHEFLHAVAFAHEHQNMRGPCADEFRWDDDHGYTPTQNVRGQYVADAQGRRPGIYTYLSGAPNFWGRETVDRNLRTGVFEDGVASTFDPESVMLYRFDSLFYRSSPSACAPTTEGIELSDGDRRGLALLYPQDLDARQALADRAAEAYDVLDDVGDDEGLESLRTGPPVDGRREAVAELLESFLAITRVAAAGPVGGDDMSWEDQLRRAVASASDEVLSAAVARIIDLLADGELDDDGVVTAVGVLRDARSWTHLVEVCEAVVARDRVLPPSVRKRYAQALVDQGALTAAELVLVRLRDDPGAAAEHGEAVGLLGRIAKQRFVTSGSHRRLRDAIAQYAAALEGPGRDVVWHATNLIALRRRAERDGVDVDERIAGVRELEEELEAALVREDGQRSIWEAAAEVELHLSRQRWRDAVEAASALAEADRATPFELGALRRQLVEVWGLQPEDEVMVALGESQLDLGIDADQPLPDAAHLEKILGAEMMIPHETYVRGLEVARSVCRVETVYGQKVGTGFLLPAAELEEGRDGWFVMTNHHVVNDTGAFPGSSRPDRVQLRFTLATDANGEPLPPVRSPELVWTSPVAELDATVLEIEAPEQLRRRPILRATVPPTMDEPDPYVFVIGHPGGRELEYSIRGNQLLDVSTSRLQYRAPTDHGSSGSPVFDRSWQLVGIHHKGHDRLPALTGPGRRHPANQGSRIDAIVAAGFGRGG